MKRPTAIDVEGEGPAVVLVHGLGLNRDMWQWQLPALVQSYRVIRYDLIGHGDSRMPDGACSMDDVVAQLDEVLAETETERAAIVGFSLGGLIARAFALAHPRKTAALVIMNSAHARTREQREAIQARVDQARDAGPSATIEDALQRWFSDEFATANPGVLDQVRGWVVANDPVAYPAMYSLLAEGDRGLETEIAAIDCPTLVMTGEDDHGNSPAMASQVASLIDGAEAAVLPGLRHMALAEDPGVVNDLLLSFLQRNLTAQEQQQSGVY